LVGSRNHPDGSRCPYRWRDKTTLVDLSITVVVDAIRADLVNLSFQGIADVIASANAVFDRMKTGPDAAGGFAEIFVGLAVAIVIETIADLGSGVFQRDAHGDVAVDTTRQGLLANPLAAGDVLQALVYFTIAVIVLAIALLWSATQMGVASRHNSADAVGDDVQTFTHSAVGCAQVVVDESATIVVQPIADLFRCPGQRIAGLLFAIFAVVDGVGAGAKAAARGTELIVHQAIAVIVQSVADLGDCSLKRIAELGHLIDAGGDRMGAFAQSACIRAELFVDRAVTVVVQTITDFRAGSLEGITDLRDPTHTIIDGVVTYADPAKARPLVFVKGTITVVVDPITDFVTGPFEGATELNDTVLARVHGLFTRSQATVQFTQVFIHGSIAVVVEGVTGLSRGAFKGVAFQDLPPRADVNGMLAYTQSTATGTKNLVGFAVTIVVDPVAHLLARFSGTTFGQARVGTDPLALAEVRSTCRGGVVVDGVGTAATNACVGHTLGEALFVFWIGKCVAAIALGAVQPIGTVDATEGPLQIATEHTAVGRATTTGLAIQVQVAGTTKIYIDIQA